MFKQNYFNPTNIKEKNQICIKMLKIIFLGKMLPPSAFAFERIY